ncbi:MAG: hypothetical protein ACYCT0_03560 [Sulfobacillus sp.]
MERKPHPSDSRAKVLTLTTSGPDILERAMRLVERVDQEFFSRLSPDSTKAAAIFHKLLILD